MEAELKSPKGCLKNMKYHLLQRVDEVLQVDIISVLSDVCQKEVVDPFLDLTLKHHRQHSHCELQDEDEADHTRKLKRNSKEKKH